MLKALISSKLSKRDIWLTTVLDMYKGYQNLLFGTCPMTLDDNDGPNDVNIFRKKLFFTFY